MNKFKLKEGKNHFAFIGSAGVPNRYGGFEAFLENCCPEIVTIGHTVTVTCDRSLYESLEGQYKGVIRKFISVRANGAASVLHDLLAFFSVYRSATHIFVLGVSGGIWFPIWRVMCDLSGKRLIVNIDGVEWRRSKFPAWKRRLLKTFDSLAQKFSHTIIFDNQELLEFIKPKHRKKSVEIAYSGDHVLHLPNIKKIPKTALTICRIEPENQIELLIEGALRSKIKTYTIIGNWDSSAYGRLIRKKHSNNEILRLLDPIYDANALASTRGQCEYYLHGHSVGGTNPSLVEMLFYDCTILCFDCSFNRATARDAALYFRDADDVVALIDEPKTHLHDRTLLRARYTANSIALKYVEAGETQRD